MKEEDKWMIGGNASTFVDKHKNSLSPAKRHALEQMLKEFAISQVIEFCPLQKIPQELKYIYICNSLEDQNTLNGNTIGIINGRVSPTMIHLILEDFADNKIRFIAILKSQVWRGGMSYKSNGFKIVPFLIGIPEDEKIKVIERLNYNIR